ncbi:sodium/calcium exchanger family protein / calcium-binding EF hand family protein [Prunus dulcis]|uniref:Sodium/calcium exchanger family protein / calcium-binding EF hand family protein n=1 Tax=Prunus dulcis TaxID=3755 RepID=A0A4Y1RBU2_PRUDU|nr:sodium/calcium exchanger family protein / calcium-binding EF hand family protein [Prunus dulcis]
MVGHGNNNVPNLWNPCDFNLDQKESSNSGIDPGLAFRSTLNLPFESNNPIWPLTNVPQRTQPYHQQPPPPPSMVNVSSATSSSSVLNFQIEPLQTKAITATIHLCGRMKKREAPSCSTSISESNSRNSIKENGSVNGDFLTLALQQPGNAEDTNFQPGPSCSHPQQAFYSFFPPAKAQIGRAATTINNNCNGELGESVDLNLKL